MTRSKNFYLEKSNNVISLGKRLAVFHAHDEFIITNKGKILATNNNLPYLIGLSCLLEGYESNLNFIDTSEVTNFSNLFSTESRAFTLRKDDFSKLNSQQRDNNIQIFYKDKKNIKNIISFTKQKNPKLLVVMPLSGMPNDFDDSSYQYFLSLSHFNGFIDEWSYDKVEYLSNMFSYSSFNQHDLVFNCPNLVEAVMMFYKSDFSKNITFETPLPQLMNINHMLHLSRPHNISMDLTKSTNLDNIEYAFFHLSLKKLSNIKLPPFHSINGFCDLENFINPKLLLNQAEKFNDDFKNFFKDLNDCIFFSNFLSLGIEYANFDKENFWQKIQFLKAIFVNSFMPKSVKEECLKTFKKYYLENKNITSNLTNGEKKVVFSLLKEISKQDEWKENFKEHLVQHSLLNNDDCHFNINSIENCGYKKIVI